MNRKRVVNRGVVWLLYPFIEPSSRRFFSLFQTTQLGGHSYKASYSDDTTTRRHAFARLRTKKHVQKFKLRDLLVLTYDVSPQLNKHLFTTRTTDRLFLSALLRKPPKTSKNKAWLIYHRKKTPGNTSSIADHHSLHSDTHHHQFHAHAHHHHHHHAPPCPAVPLRCFLYHVLGLCWQCTQSILYFTRLFALYKLYHPL